MEVGDNVNRMVGPKVCFGRIVRVVSPTLAIVNWFAPPLGLTTYRFKKEEEDVSSKPLVLPFIT